MPGRADVGPIRRFRTPRGLRSRLPRMAGDAPGTMERTCGAGRVT
jgi:hypothetical protein